MTAAAVQSGLPAPVFVAGIKYGSIFEASKQIGISYNAMHKAVKKSGYGVCRIKRNIVVLELWVLNRINNMRCAV